MSTIVYIYIYYIDMYNIYIYREREIIIHRIQIEFYNRIRSVRYGSEKKTNAPELSRAYISRVAVILKQKKFSRKTLFGFLSSKRYFVFAKFQSIEYVRLR